MRNPLVLALLACVLLLSACAGGSAAIRSKKGPMPEGGDFTGVWFSSEYGEMHLHQTDDRVAGWYKKNERLGKIQGTVEGNILRFEWEEKREMVMGKPTTTSGHGYFVYVIDKEERGKAKYEVHRLEGEWGLGDDDTGGGEWTATKSRSREPQAKPPSEA